MNCEICGKDMGDIAVSLPLKKADGSLNTMVCLKCARESRVYCKKHQNPHLGFIDGTSACMYCIGEMVAKNRRKEANIFDSLRQKLPPEEFKQLLRWATASYLVTGNTKETCILRAIATKAKRSNQSIEEVLGEIIETNSVKYILPLEIYP